MTYFSDAFQRQLEGLFHRTADAGILNAHLDRRLSRQTSVGHSVSSYIYGRLSQVVLLYSPPTHQRLSTLHYEVAHTVEHLPHLTPTKHLDVYDAEFKHQQPGFGQQRRSPVASPGSKFEPTTEIESCSREW